MAITVKHTKVSTIPDGDDSSLIRPSDWNDDHVLTGTVPVANGGTGASTLTGYVKGNGTSAMTASSTIPSTDVTGLGTMSTQNANSVNITGGSISGATVSGYIPTTEKAQPLGVATLDAGGKVPTSQIPQMGDLNYQGTWNASTNTPTLTSSTGTKGYYYVVSVAGTTNLDGITDWQIGDWAVYNGTVWQKIDNTDAVTSVNGYTGTVVLNYADVGAFPATTTTGTGSVVLQTSPTINTPTLSGATVDGAAAYLNFTPTTAPTYVEGRVFYDSTAKTLNYYNDNSQMSVNIGQEEIVRVRNQTGATLTNGTVVYINGATGNTPTVNKAIATSFSTADVIGVLTTDIANNGFGYATISGLVNGLDTSAFADGDPVFLSATTAGTFTTTEPTRPNYSIQVGVVLRANPSVGTLLVSIQIVSVETQHIIGTMAVDQGGTGQTSYTDGQLLIGNSTGNTLTKSTLTAGTAIGITNGAGSITVNNTGVTSAVAGTGISVSGATGAVTVTNTAPDQTVAIASGTGISVTGTYPNFTVTNTSPSSGGTVTSITAGTGLSGGTITSSGTIALANTTVSAGSYTNSSITVDAQGRLTSASSGTAPVTSVTATSPVVSTGGTNPVISMPAATGSVNGYLTSTDWTTFNNKGSGTVTSVAALTLGTTGTDLSSTVANGTTTPVITLNVPTASASNRGALSSTDWTTFNNKAPSVTYTTNYVPFGQGTTTPNLSASFTYVTGTGTLTAPAVSASNGLVVNSNTVSASYSIPSGSSASSVGPMTVASGQTVTVPSSSRWVVL